MTEPDDTESGQRQGIDAAEAAGAEQEPTVEITGEGDDTGAEGVTFEVVEGELENGESVPRRGVYLLPNLFTTGALFAGFYAIIAGVKGQYDHAAMAMFVSMLLDILDGRVARMTNTQSAFGAEYDSLADCISFGAAPALVSYTWSLNSLGKFGWMICFVYIACAALRLARFNVQVESADKRYFIGLPSPAAAALVAGMVWVGADLGLDGNQEGLVATIAAVVTAVVTFFAGVMMVSNVRYSSFKEVHWKNRVPFVAILVVVLALAVVSTHPPGVLLVIALVYALSGPVMALRGRRSK